LIVPVLFALLATTWIMAGYIGTQAAIAGAVVMTVAAVGVLVIHLILIWLTVEPGSQNSTLS